MTDTHPETRGEAPTHIRHPYKRRPRSHDVRPEQIWVIRERTDLTAREAGELVGLSLDLAKGIRQGRHYSYVPDREATELTIEQLVYLLTRHNRHDKVDLATLNIDVVSSAGAAAG